MPNNKKKRIKRGNLNESYHRQKIGEYVQPMEKKFRLNPVNFAATTAYQHRSTLSTLLDIYNKLSASEKILLVLVVLSGIVVIANAAKNTSPSVTPVVRRNCIAIKGSSNFAEKCNIERSNHAYFFKRHGQHSLAYVDGANPSFDAHIAEYNYRVVKDVIQVKHASIRLFSTEGETYSASREVAGFQEAENFLKTVLAPGELNAERTRYTREIKSKYGDKAIVQYAVAMTLIEDLHYGNIGFDKDGVVIIDSDFMPRNIRVYFEIAEHLNSQLFPFHLTLNNVQSMKEMYEAMLEKDMPIGRRDLMIDAESFKEVLKAYIYACRYILEGVETHLGRDELNPLIVEVWAGTMQYWYANVINKPMRPSL